MSDISLTCSCCALPLVLPEGAAMAVCPACGTRNARPLAQGEAFDRLQRAIAQRLGCDFSNAERSYQQVLLDHPHEHEALWGRLLCHYGVEYVNAEGGKPSPTVHAVRPKPMQSQQDYIDACRFAPAEIRARYEQEAAYIDAAQAKVRRLAAQQGAEWDVFLCHKTTEPGSDRTTEDYIRAFKVYLYLKELGLRVFFAPESLAEATGANYEAGIYHALHTSKVMLVFCSRPEYLTSPWVRSEWKRFLALIEAGEPLRLVPLLYDDYDPAHLPAEFLYHDLQALPMENFEAKDRLTRAVLAAVKPQPEPASDKKKSRLPLALLPIALLTVMLSLLLSKPSRTGLETMTQAEQLPAQPSSAAAATAVPVTAPPATPPTAAPDAPASVPTVRYADRASCTVGATVNFGRDKSSEAMQWQVLAVEDGKALLLVNTPLENLEFGIRWERSSIRTWLNHSFRESPIYFTDEERSKMLAYSTGDAQDTDYLFLLSVEEVCRYLPLAEDRILLDSRGNARSWWLRSPGSQVDTGRSYSTGVLNLAGSLIAMVKSDGAFGTMMYGSPMPVRPAFWLDLSP